MKAIIDEKLGNGDIIIQEAENAGLELAVACALVEQESGGENIFGCDHGDVGDTPPYCHQKVNKARVARLVDGGNYSHGMNGIGLTQLTWWEFVDEAEALGGAHLPANQCRVGFRLLKSYIDKYPLLEAFGAYNAGETNRRSVLDTYAAQLNEKYEAWREILRPTVYPEITLREHDGWVIDNEGTRWARMEPNLTLGTNSNGWLYVAKKDIVLPTKRWPEANVAPDPNSDWYVERHPTRYHWADGGRQDVDDWAWWLVNNYNCTVNTYYDHPASEFFPAAGGRDYDSMDIWGPGGRGDRLPFDLGEAIHAVVFDDPNLPNIEWIIWQGWMWSYGGGWEWFSNDTSDADNGHFQHIHVTYF